MGYGGADSHCALACEYAVTFNPAPIRNVVTDLRDDYISSHLMNYVSGDDFVSRLNPFAGIVLHLSGKTNKPSIVSLGEWLGEAAAGLVTDTHLFTPGITVNVKCSTGHGIDALHLAMKGIKDYQLSRWP